MSPREIIQKLSRHYYEEIKYAILGRGIMHIDDLVELLENFDRIGPINANNGERRERKSQDEIKHNQQMIQSQMQSTWRAQPGGNPQDRMRCPRPLNTPSCQRNTHGSYGSRAERGTEHNTNEKIDRNNPQLTYQIRNVEVGAEAPQEHIEEEDVPGTEPGNEHQPRL